MLNKVWSLELLLIKVITAISLKFITFIIVYNRSASSYAIWNIDIICVYHRIGTDRTSIALILSCSLDSSSYCADRTVLLHVFALYEKPENKWIIIIIIIIIIFAWSYICPRKSFKDTHCLHNDLGYAISFYLVRV